MSTSFTRIILKGTIDPINNERPNYPNFHLIKPLETLVPTVEINTNENVDFDNKVG